MKPEALSLGDIISVDLGPVMGREQDYERPALIVSPKQFNRLTGLVWAVPITTKPKGNPMEEPTVSGMKTVGVALCHQLKAINCHAREWSYCEKAPEKFVNQVRGKCIAVLRAA